jgi:hypothetical protein
MNRRSLLGWLARAPVALAAVSLPGACASVPVMAGAIVGESGAEATLPLRSLDKVTFHNKVAGMATGTQIDLNSGSVRFYSKSAVCSPADALAVHVLA